jgi:NAD-dependent SIR2 family protein deacetylase
VSLAHELWPGVQFQPTLTHHFLKMLDDKGLLLRIYSQNIDGLEFLAGIPDDKLVECHGHFRTASCIDCHRAADAEQVKETIVGDGKTPTCKHCGGNVKPDIVFFGEQLPDRFHRMLKKDIPKADLLLVMGTSLKVAPVSMIPNMVRCNKVLFNRDKVMKIRKGRDMFVPGDCDANVQKLLDLLGENIVPTTRSTDEKEGSTKNNDGEQLDKLFAKIEINEDKKQSNGGSNSRSNEKKAQPKS